MAWRGVCSSLMSGRSVSAVSLDPDTVPSQQEAITPRRVPAQARLARGVKP